MTNSIDPKAIPPGFLLRPLAGGEAIALTGDLRVGRERDCDVCLESEHISRYHACIRYGSDGFVLEDLQSTNGSYINSQRVIGTQPFSLGDELSFHNLRFRVVSDRSQDLDATRMVWPETVLDRDSTAHLEHFSSEQRAAIRQASIAQNVPSAPVVPGVEPNLVPASSASAGIPATPVVSVADHSAPKKLTAVDRQVQKMAVGNVPEVTLPERGEWFELEQEDGGLLVCYMLSAGSPGEERFYCVSRGSRGVLALSSEVLADAWCSERARLCIKPPLFGRLLLAISGAARG
jgi:hypothetical protein